MTVKIRVLKPFVFTPTPTPGVRGQPQEIAFKVGPNGEAMEYEIPDEVWAHPWMKKDFADGKIESPAQAAIRTAAEAKKAEDAAAEAAAAKARAEAAVARMEAAQGIRQEQVNADAKLLDTPRGQLRTVGNQGGSDMDVPVDELRRRQSAGVKK
jgi:hypothetical protein